MRKTLLIAAAALAAGVISSQAQTVYSQNVVGYVNQTIPANSYQIIGSQLINGSDVNQTNGDVNATLVNGLVSCAIPLNANPQLVGTNSQMLYWTGIGYATYYYFNSNDASAWIGDAPGTDPAGWYDKLQNNATLNLNSGHAAFIYNHSASPITVTTVGTVFQGTNTVLAINSGYNLINLLPAVSTNVCVDASGNQIPYGLPIGSLHSSFTGLNSTPTLASNDAILYWTGIGFSTYYFFTSDDASAWIGDAPGTDPAGFYDKLQNTMAVNPSVNQGFFLYHTGSTINWTNSFTVQ